MIPLYLPVIYRQYIVILEVSVPAATVDRPVVDLFPHIVRVELGRVSGRPDLRHPRRSHLVVRVGIPVKVGEPGVMLDIITAPLQVADAVTDVFRQQTLA